MALVFPWEPSDQRLSHLAAATGTAAILLLFGVLTGATLFSATGAVIHEGRTLFLFSDFKVSISVPFHKEESGPRLNDLLF